MNLGSSKAKIVAPIKMDLSSQVCEQFAGVFIFLFLLYSVVIHNYIV